MKKIFIIIITIFGLGYTQAQLAIGKNTVSSPSVCLDFSTTENRGLLLPWVTDQASVTDVANGTLVYDSSDKKVKVKYNSGWTDLSIDTTGTTVNPNTGLDGLDIQNSLADNPDAKVSIGDPTSTAGILVLEETNKAMVLPKVSAPDQNIINPTPGLMVYDPISHELAVFNGSVWTYWTIEN